MSNSKKYSLILSICLIFTILISTLFCIPYAKADTVNNIYTFNGSNIYIPIKSYNIGRNDNYTESGLFNYEIDINYEAETGYYIDFSNSSLNWLAYLPAQNRTLMYTYFDLKAYYVDSSYYYNLSKVPISSFVLQDDISYINSSNQSPREVYGLYLNIYPTNYMNNNNTCSIFIQTDIQSDLFVPDIISTRFGYYLSSFASNYGDRYWNYVQYNFRDGHYIRFSFYVGNSWAIDTQSGTVYSPISSLLDTRVYYFDTEFTQDVYYDNGYADGKEDGYTDGYLNGYNKGSNDGFDLGYDEGKREGILEANDYSFTGLLTAVVDAPITVLFGNGRDDVGLLNFNILGFNLASIYLGLFTFMIILYIVKLVMKGG